MTEDDLKQRLTRYEAQSAESLRLLQRHDAALYGAGPETTGILADLATIKEQLRQMRAIHSDQVPPLWACMTLALVSLALSLWVLLHGAASPAASAAPASPAAELANLRGEPAPAALDRP